MERKAGKGEENKDMMYIQGLLPGYGCEKLPTGISCRGEGLTDEQYRKLVGDVKSHFGTRFFEISCLDPIGYTEFVIYLSPTKI
jgi:hypothetical protein